MQNEVMIPSSRVARVSDMRILPALDEDAILLVVKDGKCWKLPVKALKNLVQNKVENSVLTSINNIKDKLVSTTKTHKYEISELKPIVEKCNKSLSSIQENFTNKYNKLSVNFSQSLSESNDKLTKDIADIINNIDKLQVLTKQQNSSLENLKLSSDKHSRNISALISNVDNIKSISQRNSQNISDISADFIRTNSKNKEQYDDFNNRCTQIQLLVKQHDNDIKTVNSTLAENEKQQSIFDSSLQSNFNNIQAISTDFHAFKDRTDKAIAVMKDNFLSSNVALNSKIYEYNKSVSTISTMLSNEVASNISSTLKKTQALYDKLDIMEKTENILKISLSNIQQHILKHLSIDTDVLDAKISSLSTAIAKQHEDRNREALDVQQLEAKLYGVNVQQVDETGNRNTEQIDVGDIARIMNMLEELSSKVDAFSKSEQK